MCGNNIEIYTCGHSVFAGINFCPDYFKLTQDRTPICPGIGANNSHMDNIIRHGSICEDCQDKKQQAIQREGEMVWRRGRARVEKASRKQRSKRGEERE
ncbi:hypothetical protein NEUTE1DRAFT_50174 [Neurospora tetrasperma FGSC 2508]|uniref:Uncharacterized protein n=1 Tax=Neurospora tetrasperma (strain FGSC 2508 / ATCC MYA-4615 / P0657) TaxID=510951 RepID=F8MWL7_NEUT8|nr:uncharacterized protein NEUTE1DRAFT_50174 [Neurospora tetrasperma FGSC 2508]EGO54138.1 hypothetical protein NEUTE1DRAFT_50174 [Neurospora tetrasperma FGSC 2508]EGZ68436.1 hypothetical protein NEUTE2DRAFT_74652 [Neurospora tetrasperma FGSC 2509]